MNETEETARPEGRVGAASPIAGVPERAVLTDAHWAALAAAAAARMPAITISRTAPWEM